MPIYEYECFGSKHRFERYQKFSDAPVTVCPDCGSGVRKVLQPVGIVFKGSGWYKNDSRSTPTSARSGADKDAATAASADGKSSGETKSNGKAKPDGTGAADAGTSGAGMKTESSSKPEGAGKPAAASTGKPT